MKIRHIAPWFIAALALLVSGDASAKPPHTPIEAFQQLQHPAAKTRRSPRHLSAPTHLLRHPSEATTSSACDAPKATAPSLLKKPNRRTILRGHRTSIWRTSIFGKASRGLHPQTHVTSSVASGTRRLTPRSWMSAMFLRLRDMITSL